MRNGKIQKSTDIVFYDNIKHGYTVNGVEGAKDNRTGAGDGDD